MRKDKKVEMESLYSESKEGMVIESNMEVSIELTYENIKNLLANIEKEHGKLKVKYLKYQDKHKTATSRKSMYEKKMYEISHDIDVLSMQYCDILVVANERWWIDDLLNEDGLQKWGVEQVNKLKETLREQSRQKVDSVIISSMEKASKVQDVDFEWIWQVIASKIDTDAEE